MALQPAAMLGGHGVLSYYRLRILFRHGPETAAWRMVSVGAWRDDGAYHVNLENRSGTGVRSEEHTSELQSLMRISYAVFCLKKKTTILLLLYQIYSLPHL